MFVIGIACQYHFVGGINLLTAVSSVQLAHYVNSQAYTYIAKPALPIVFFLCFHHHALCAIINFGIHINYILYSFIST